MSRDVAAKIAEGKSLNDFEVEYARKRGIPLPEKYGDSPTDEQVTPGEGPVVQTGPAQAEETALEDLSKEQLMDLAAEEGIRGRSSMNKDELVAALSGEEVLEDGDSE